MMWKLPEIAIDEAMQTPYNKRFRVRFISPKGQSRIKQISCRYEGSRDGMISAGRASLHATEQEQI